MFPSLFVCVAFCISTALKLIDAISKFTNNKNWDFFILHLQKQDFIDIIKSIVLDKQNNFGMRFSDFYHFQDP